MEAPKDHRIAPVARSFPLACDPTRDFGNRDGFHIGIKLAMLLHNQPGLLTRQKTSPERQMLLWPVNVKRHAKLDWPPRPKPARCVRHETGTAT